MKVSPVGETSLSGKKAATQHPLGSFVLQLCAAERGLCVNGHRLEVPAIAPELIVEREPVAPCPPGRKPAGGWYRRGSGVCRKEHREVSLWGREVDERLGFRREEEPASWKWLAWLAGSSRCCMSYPARLSPLRGSGDLVAGCFSGLC